MAYPILRITGGPEQGREIVVPEGATVLGSEAEGPGRLTGAGIPPEAGALLWRPGEEVKLDAMPDVIINGKPGEPMTELTSGSTVTIGECEMVFEQREGVHPKDRAQIEAMEEAAAGNAPYRWAVHFKPKGGEKTDGIIEAGAGQLGLIGTDGAVAFRVPIPELTDVSFPAHRSSVMEFVANGVEYKVWLLAPAWVPGQIDFDRLQTGPMVDPQSVPAGGSFESHQDATAIVGAIDLAFGVAASLGARWERTTWKKVLRGEVQGEEAAAEAASSYVSSDNESVS